MFLLFYCIDTSVLDHNSTGYRNIEGNLSIYGCLFSRNNEYEGSGGIIHLKKVQCQLNINSCIFKHCSSKGLGGCLFFEGSEKENTFLIMSKTCIYSCFSSEYKNAHFAYIVLTSKWDNVTKFDSCIITKCAPFSIGKGFLDITATLASITSSNFSNNMNNQMGCVRSGYSFQFECKYILASQNGPSSIFYYETTYNSVLDHVCFINNFISESHFIIEILSSMNKVVFCSFINNTGSTARQVSSTLIFDNCTYLSQKIIFNPATSFSGFSLTSTIRIDNIYYQNMSCFPESIQNSSKFNALPYVVSIFAILLIISMLYLLWNQINIKRSIMIEHSMYKEFG